MDEDARTRLLRSLATSDLSSPSLSDIQLILESLTIHTSKTSRPIAFTVLARILSAISLPAADNGEPPHPSEPLHPILSSVKKITHEWLSKAEAEATVSSLAALTCIFELAPACALAILSSPGFAEAAADAVEVSSISSSLTRTTFVAQGEGGTEASSDVEGSLARLLASALSTRQARTAIATYWPSALTLLTSLSAPTFKASIRARSAAAVAIAKLRLAESVEPEPAKLVTQAPSNESLASDLISVISLARPSPPMASCEDVLPPEAVSALEGLAVLVSYPPIRRRVALSFSSLRPMFTQFARVDSACAYVIGSILVTVSGYKPLLNAEDAAKDKLRKLAAQKAVDREGVTKEAEDEDGTDTAAAERNQTLLKHDVMSLANVLAKTPSSGVRRLAGKLILNLVERQEMRRDVIAGGGAKLLLHIIGAIPVPSSPPTIPPKKLSAPVLLEVEDSSTLQALAKLLITASPLLLLGPRPDSPSMLNAIPPLLTLLLHPSSTLLHTFEALMALTNLASLGPPPEPAERIASSSVVLSKLEELWLSNHSLVRRAATELTCNLSNCSKGWERYTGELSNGVGPSTPEGARALKATGQRLKILVALCTAEDDPTRTAASGALAGLTRSPLVCLSLLSNPRAVPILVELLHQSQEALAGQPERTKAFEEGLRLRAVECLKNLALFAKASGSNNIKSQVRLAVETPLTQAVESGYAVEVKTAAQEGLDAIQSGK